MLRVDLEAVSQTTADVRCGSRNEILDCEHQQRSRLLVQHACSKQCPSECSEQIDAKGALSVDCLKQGLALGRVWMNVIQHKSIGERSGDRVETFDDEVYIVQCASVDGATMCAQARFYCETTCKCAVAKAIRQKLLTTSEARLASLAFRKAENTANDSFGVYILSNAVMSSRESTRALIVCGAGESSSSRWRARGRARIPRCCS